MKTNAYLPITAATYITLLRLACIPFIFVSLIHQAWIALTILFIIASLTDVLDGHIARSYGQVSWLGTVLDPLVDKLLLLTVYAGLSYKTFIPITLPVWFVYFVLIHELLLIVGASYISLYKNKIQLRPSWLAKLVGVAQFLFIVWILLSGFVGTINEKLFYQLLILLTLGRLCVIINYCRSTYKSLRESS